MKILLVTHRYPPRTGGVETHVQEIATRLADHGHEVTVFSADAGSDVPTKNTGKGVRVRRFRSVSLNGAFYVSPRMASAVRRADADIVHAHNYHAFPLLFAALGATDERFVVTTHYHGESASRSRDVLLSLYRPFGRWAVGQADEVIAVSEWERDRLCEDFDVGATVIPNGVDVERFANTEREKRERPYLLCVGRLEEYKGIQHAIRALPELPEYELVVVGSGPYREVLKGIAREESVLDRVAFLGFIDLSRLPLLYAGADVYITLSQFESYGMTVAESLAAKTPCVIRDKGGLSDWCDETGVRCITDISPSNVAEKVAEAVGDTVDANLPTWDDVASWMLKVYRF